MYFFHPYRFRINPDGTGLYGIGAIGSRSIDYGTYPQSKSFVFGINVEF